MTVILVEVSTDLARYDYNDDDYGCADDDGGDDGLDDDNDGYPCRTPLVMLTVASVNARMGCAAGFFKS